MESIAENALQEQDARLRAINRIFQETFRCDSAIPVAERCLEMAAELTASKVGFIGEQSESGLLAPRAILTPESRSCAGRACEAAAFLSRTALMEMALATLAQGQSQIVNEPVGENSEHRWGPESHSEFLPITCFLGVRLQRAEKTFGILALANKEGGYTAADRQSVEILSAAFVEAWCHQRSQEALRLSEQRLSLALQGGQGGTWDWDLASGAAWWSPQMYDLWGVEPGTPMHTENSFALIDADDRPYVHRAIASAIANHSSPQYEFRIHHDTRGCRWMATRAHILRDGEGRAVRIVGITLDITEIKRAQETIVRANEEWERTFNSVPDLIAVLDNEHRIVRVNRAMAQRLGLTPEECIGRACYHCMHGAAEPPAYCPYALTRADGREHAAEVREDHLGGDFLITTTALYNKCGEQIGSVHVAHDVTERKRSEEALRRAYQKLEDAHRDLQQLQSQLVQSEKLASIGQLAAGVAHEMNTPVGFVASNFQTLEGYVSKIRDLLTQYEELLTRLEPMGDSQLRSSADRIRQWRHDKRIDFILEDIQALFADSREGLERVTSIVQNLRDFSRIDQPGSRDAYDLNRGIEATLIVARNEIKYDADVRAAFAELPAVYCHAGQINQVLLNILVNAAQAIRSQQRDNRGTITIRTYVAEGQVVCEIADDGPGIAPEHLSKIFDPFFTTKPPGKGTGLGLSVSYDIIVHKHNGRLLVESRPGAGTKFTIRLPLGTQEQPEKETARDGKKNRIVCG